MFSPKASPALSFTPEAHNLLLNPKIHRQLHSQPEGHPKRRRPRRGGTGPCEAGQRGPGRLDRSKPRDSETTEKTTTRVLPHPPTSDPPSSKIRKRNKEEKKNAVETGQEVACAIVRGGGGPYRRCNDVRRVNSLFCRHKMLRADIPLALQKTVTKFKDVQLLDKKGGNKSHNCHSQ